MNPVHRFLGLVGVNHPDHLNSALWQRPPHSTRSLMAAAPLPFTTSPDIEDLFTAEDVAKLSGLITTKDCLALVALAPRTTIQALQFDAVIRACYQHVATSFDGFLIQTSWPSAIMLEEARRVSPQLTLVVETSLTWSGRTLAPEEVVERARFYSTSINALVLNVSEQGALTLDSALILHYLEALHRANLPLGIGIAGAIGPETIDTLKEVADQFPNTSFQAEHDLRGLDLQLDTARIATVFSKGFAL